MPNKDLARAKPDLSFPKFSCSYRTVNRQDIINLNRLIVRCAEDAIFYKDERDWIPDFIAKNRRYRIETVTRKIQQGTLSPLWFSQRVIQYTPD